MTMRAEYWYQRDEVARAAANSRIVASAADIDEVLELIKIGWLTDLALFTDTQQLVVGRFDSGYVAAAYWGPDGTFYTEGEGPDFTTSFFQTDFPADVRISLEAMRSVLGDFVSSGQRSNIVTWQQAPSAPAISAEEHDEFAGIFNSWPGNAACAS